MSPCLRKQNSPHKMDACGSLLPRPFNLYPTSGPSVLLFCFGVMRIPQRRISPRLIIPSLLQCRRAPCEPRCTRYIPVSAMALHPSSPCVRPVSFDIQCGWLLSCIRAAPTRCGSAPGSCWHSLSAELVACRALNTELHSRKAVVCSSVLFLQWSLLLSSLPLCAMGASVHDCRALVEEERNARKHPVGSPCKTKCYRKGEDTAKLLCIVFGVISP